MQKAVAAREQHPKHVQENSTLVSSAEISRRQDPFPVYCSRCSKGDPDRFDSED